jgi:hypothetical protein
MHERFSLSKSLHPIVRIARRKGWSIKTNEQDKQHPATIYVDIG